MSNASSIPQELALCMLGNFPCFFFILSGDFFFSKLTISKNYFRNTNRVSNSLDPDQDRHLGPDCLQRLSADNKKCH